MPCLTMAHLPWSTGWTDPTNLETVFLTASLDSDTLDLPETTEHRDTSRSETPVPTTDAAAPQ